MSQSFTIQILNQSFNVVSNDQKEHVQAVADFVDQRMKKIAKNGSSISTAHVAILTALNIADELFKKQNELAHNQKAWLSQIDSIIKKLANQDLSS